jgi:hypothetical protein
VIDDHGARRPARQFGVAFGPRVAGVSGIVPGNRMRAGHEARCAVAGAEFVDHDDEADQRPRILLAAHVDMQLLRLRPR